LEIALSGSKIEKSAADCAGVLTSLKAILKPFEKHLTVVKDSDKGYYLNAAYSEKFKRDMFFGAVEIKKNYVSYYLFPVYIFPQLLNDISPELKKRMQGKSCFNFTAIDNKLFSELQLLTKSGFRMMKDNGFVRGK